jgi:hypothetical protein
MRSSMHIRAHTTVDIKFSRHDFNTHTHIHTYIHIHKRYIHTQFVDASLEFTSGRTPLLISNSRVMISKALSNLTDSIGCHGNNTDMYVCVYVCMYACMCVCMYTYVCVRVIYVWCQTLASLFQTRCPIWLIRLDATGITLTCMYVCMHVCMYRCTYTYVCVGVIYVWCKICASWFQKFKSL